MQDLESKKGLASCHFTRRRANTLRGVEVGGGGEVKMCNGGKRKVEPQKYKAPIEINPSLPCSKVNMCTNGQVILVGDYSLNGEFPWTDCRPLLSSDNVRPVVARSPLRD